MPFTRFIPLKAAPLCLKIISFPFIFHPFSCSYHSIFICIIELIVYFKQTIFIKSTCLRRKVIFFIVQFCPACSLFTVYIIEGISVFFFQAVPSRRWEDVHISLCQQLLQDCKMPVAATLGLLPSYNPRSRNPYPRHSIQEFLRSVFW